MNLPPDFSKITLQKGFISLSNAIDNGKLPNSNLIVASDREISDYAARVIAKKVLDVSNLESCVDFFNIKPGGAMRQITADQIRELCAAIYLTPKVCDKKFVLISCAECMNASAANAFLKTLEEPPADTVIFLTTSKFYNILPTISGRCVVTRLQMHGNVIKNEEIQNWLTDYCSWLTSLFESVGDKKINVIMHMYRLLTKLENLVTTMDEGNFGFENKREIYDVLFLAIENQTADFFRKNLNYVKIFHRAIDRLEDKAQLVALNVNFLACIEAFLMEIFQIAVTAHVQK